MINSEWTEEEDAQRCSAVAYFGDSNWQNVASVLERRTGTQCSNRWKKSICPVRKGSFTLKEDERLTVAVMLFGRKWNQIAKYVPGRIQSQCRDRYLNSLDPSLKWGGWTEDEDLRLEAAITKYGYCWSKVAEYVPLRTDSQCRKWKVICHEQVPLLQETRKRQRSLLAGNFVDRESERPALTPNDFIPLRMVASPSDVGAKISKGSGRDSRGTLSLNYLSFWVNSRFLGFWPILGFSADFLGLGNFWFHSF
ncbi:transcription factor MYB3R-2-like isoform X2 [Trifolium pratense]|uniref:transcription factor MYB3R-2-like isoform X2 n=1 Tax=Trifolium pratense TaxID=57577 RepID=UPI001E69771E|nr:transcription factor MYB3R-2-like isoform X2 [Trifolium pratense]